MDISRGYVFEPSTDCINSRRPKFNIMIDETGRAVLAGFSLITLIPDRSTILSTCIDGGSVRWMSPELHDPESYGLQTVQSTRESDCYALGMVVYEILSGRLPYDTDNPFVILRKVLDGKRPERPEGEGGKWFTTGMWDMVQLCWKAEPGERASARDVLLCLEEDSPNVDGDDDRSYGASTDSQYFSDEWDAVESDTSGFSLFYPKLPVNHHRGMAGSPIIPDEGGPLVPPLDSPPGVPPGPVIPHHGGGPPDPPQVVNPEGWIGDWLAHIIWYIFNAVIGRIHIL